MTVPLIVLAVLSVVGGVLNLPSALGGNHWLANFLDPVFAAGNARVGATVPDHSTEYILMGVSAVVAIVMAVMAYNKYVKNTHVPVADDGERTPLAKLSYNKFYVDELYDAVVVKPLNRLSVFFYRVVDRSIIDGIVNILGGSPAESGKGIRLLQTGNVGFYIFGMVIGVIALLIYGILA